MGSTKEDEGMANMGKHNDQTSHRPKRVDEQYSPPESQFAETWDAPPGAAHARKSWSEKRAERKAAREQLFANQQQIKKWAKESKPAFKVGAPFSKVYIWDDRIANKETGEVYRLDGVSAEYENDAAVTQRITMTRAATGIGLFFPKQVDKGHAFITLTGPSFTWSIDLGEGRMLQKAARDQAAKINSHVRSRTASGSAHSDEG